MPVRYRVDTALGVVFAEASGPVRDEDLLDYARKMAGDPQLRSGLRELIDLRGADLRAITSEAVREVAAIFAAHDSTSPTGRIAIVAPADSSYGLSRMYQAYREPAPVDLRVFREIGEARAWLGLPEDEA